MKKGSTAVAAAAAAAGGLVVRAVGQRASGDWAPGRSDESASRWRSVTVLASADEVMPEGRPPAPLAELGEAVEVRTQPAPGGRGTELSARLRDTSGTGALARLAGDDPRQDLRSALRRSKQLVEVGEVLTVDGQPAGHRPATPGGRALDLVTRRASGEGML